MGSRIVLQSPWQHQSVWPLLILFLSLFFATCRPFWSVHSEKVCFMFDLLCSGKWTWDKIYLPSPTKKSRSILVILKIQLSLTFPALKPHSKVHYLCLHKAVWLMTYDRDAYQTMWHNVNFVSGSSIQPGHRPVSCWISMKSSLTLAACRGQWTYQQIYANVK